MHDREKIIREKREIEASRKGIMGLDGKYGTIARNLGQPIICHGGGSLFESSSADYLDIYGEVEEEVMPTMDEDATVQEMGWHWDGLKFGIHIEIRYLSDKKELLVTWKGFPVYAEVQGELEAYNPGGDWQEQLEPVFRMAKRKEAQYRQQMSAEQRQESREASLTWLEKLRGAMGYMIDGKIHNNLDWMEKPYTRAPAPLPYKLQNYMNLITSNPENLNGAHEKPSNYHYQPIELNGIAARDEEGWKDMYSRLYSFQDWETKKALSAGQPGKIKSKDFGPEMTDAEYKKWHGLSEAAEERIQQAAFRIEGRIYPCGPIHDSSVIPDHEYGKDWESGFVTTHGRFLTRNEASEFLYGKAGGKYHALDSLEVPKFYRGKDAI